MNYKTSLDGLTAYLVSLHVYGCGEVTCRRIAEAVGGDIIDICCRDDRRDELTRIEGIGPAKAEALIAAVRQRHGDTLTDDERSDNERERRQVEFFGAMGIHGWTLMRILQHFGDMAMDEVKADPYRLSEIDGFGFQRADDVARRMGIAASDPRRIQAAIIFTLTDITQRNGHCYLRHDALISITARQLQISPDAVACEEQALEQAERLVSDGDSIYLPAHYWAEHQVARRMRHLLNSRALPPSVATEWGRAEIERRDQADPMWRWRER